MKYFGCFPFTKMNDTDMNRIWTIYRSSPFLQRNTERMKRPLKKQQIELLLYLRKFSFLEIVWISLKAYSFFILVYKSFWELTLHFRYMRKTVLDSGGKQRLSSVKEVDGHTLWGHDVTDTLHVILTGDFRKHYFSWLGHFLHRHLCALNSSFLCLRDPGYRTI